MLLFLQDLEIVVSSGYRRTNDVKQKKQKLENNTTPKQDQNTTPHNNRGTATLHTEGPETIHSHLIVFLITLSTLQ